MTQIGHIVIGLIVVVAAIYLIIFISQRLTARKVSKLLDEKKELQDVPMRDRLVAGRQMSLTGQSLRQFQVLEGKYSQLELHGFHKIEDQANAVLFESQGLNFVKTTQEMRQLRELIKDARDTLDLVTQGLDDLAQLDEAHKQAVKDLESKYQDLRKVLLSQNYTFGPAIDKLEEILSSLEDDFSDFSRLTEEGDHASASDIYEALAMETNQLEERIKQIPAMVKDLEKTLPAQLAELQEAWDHFNDEGFNFTTDIERELSELEKQRQAALDDVTELTLKKASERITTLDEGVSTLYDIFDTEAEAKETVTETHMLLNEYLHHNKRQNHELFIELDRLNQDFVLGRDETSKIRSWELQLENVEQQLFAFDKAVKDHEVIYSELGPGQDEVKAELERIEQEQLDMWDMFRELPQILQQSRNRVILLADKLRQVQRNIERQGMPGLPEQYLSIFTAVSDELERLKQQLSFTRVNVDDVQRQLSIVVSDMETLQERTIQVVEAAAVTERLVRKAVQYRNFPEVVKAAEEARYYYEKEFDYNRAMTILGEALDRCEPGVWDKTIETYRQENELLQTEFAQKTE